uniref:Uncharacterized protein n=1 Tax=Staphylococcus xylosus TaxID=1288 RepID=A0A077RJE9_STAXY|nr:hypothetical protein [Staphylococcus xylosus]
MKIRDLNLDDYVIVYDIGKSEYSDGMTVVGRVDEIIFNEDDKNEAGIDSLGNLYEITDDNHFYLWSNYIESKTESLSDSPELNGFTVDEKLLEEAKEKGIDELRRNMLQSNDVQQRKRNKKIVQWSDDIKLKFIERVIQDLSPLAAYHIDNAIDVLAVAESKEDIEQARWSIQRAYENWD